MMKSIDNDDNNDNDKDEGWRIPPQFLLVLIPLMISVAKIHKKLVFWILY